VGRGAFIEASNDEIDAGVRKGSADEHLVVERVSAGRLIIDDRGITTAPSAPLASEMAPEWMQLSGPLSMPLHASFATMREERNRGSEKNMDVVRLRFEAQQCYLRATRAVRSGDMVDVARLHALGGRLSAIADQAEQWPLVTPVTKMDSDEARHRLSDPGGDHSIVPGEAVSF
jgi:hypothetical protein